MASLATPHYDTKSGGEVVYVPRVPPVFVLATFLMGALAFVVGFLWSDSIKATVEKLQTEYPEVDPLLFKYLTAAIMTLVSAAVAFLLYWILRVAYPPMQVKSGDERA